MMGTFVQALFWWCLVEGLGRLVLLLGGYSPRTKEVTVCDDVAALVVWAGIALWAAYLLWGRA